MMSKGLDDLYHVCRWCKYYKDGMCINGCFGAGDSVDILDIYAIAESGKLSGVIEETLNSIKPVKIERELRDKLFSFKLSEKRVGEVLQLFRECLGEFLDFECKSKLGEEISRLYQAVKTGDGDGVEIKDPHTFYCKEFW